MARKLNSNTATATAAVAEDAGGDANALDTMHPERDVRVAGQILTVREYGFLEGLALQPLAAPVLDQLVEASSAGDNALDHIIGMLTDQPHIMLRLVAESCVPPAMPGDDKTARAEKVDDLIALLQDPTQTSDTDGQALLMTWWVVNGGFFVRRVVRRLAARRTNKALPSPASTGPTSSSPSPVSAESTNPARSATATPSVN